jgi:hypothetical protein
VQEVLEQAELVLAVDERSLEHLRAAGAAAVGDDAERPVGGDRARLALERVLARGLERDRARGGVHRRLADEDRARCGRGLEA